MEAFFKPDPLGVGTKGLVFIGDEIIVYRRDSTAPKHPNELDVPGGGKENNETPFETFRREVKEEFGLDITETDIAYARRHASTLESGMFGWFAVAKLPATAKHHIVFGDEGAEYMLMPLDTYLQRTDAWPTYQERATDYAKSGGVY